jgi:hypothetical protein
MADEESEIRRMAEIADAINAILDADPVGDTPAEGATTPRNEPQTETRSETAAQPVAATPNMPSAADEDIIPANAAPLAVDDASGDNAIEDLDAAIAAEIGDEVSDQFGPTPDIDFAADTPPNKEIGREVHADSQMADLSLRMQDTLAEIRTGNLIHGASNQEMLGQMEAARNAIVAATREKVEQLNSETASRKQAILEHFEQLESQNSLLRDEMEIQILKFEDELKQIQQKYFENAVTDRDRLDRYREFLKYLLTERGTKI